jgi:hypothetical protein
MKRNNIVILVVFTTYIIKHFYEIYFILDLGVKYKLDSILGNNFFSFIIVLLLDFFPLFLGYFLLNKHTTAPANVFKITNSKQLLFIFCSFSPLVAYGLLVGDFVLFQLQLDVLGVIIEPLYLFFVVIWFLFYQLYGRTNLGFIPVITLVILIYFIVDFIGLQGMNDWSSNESIKTVATLALLSWVFIERKRNLFVPIALIFGIYVIPYIFKFSETSNEIKPLFVFTYCWIIALTLCFKWYMKETFELNASTILIRNEEK